MDQKRCDLRNKTIEKALAMNSALIFPKDHYKQWDKLPVFNLLDGNFDKLIPKSKLHGEFQVLQKNPPVGEGDNEEVK